MSIIGFIGIGVMGLPMARTLLRGGHQVRAFDLDPARLETIAADGASIAATAGDAASGSEYVITMLPNSDHVKTALFGPDGAAAALDEQTLAIDMSTVLPAAFDETAEQLAGMGIRMIDAPVGRTSHAAASGELLIMVGGDVEDVEKARPVLGHMGDTIIHCGPRGAGMRTKLINNYLSIASNVVVAEALTLAESAGLDQELVIEVLMGTTAGKGHLATTYPAKVLANDLEPGFMVDLAFKDLGLALEMGSDAGVALLAGTAAKEVYAAARSQGRGSQDWTGILPAVRQLSALQDPSEG